MNLRSADTGAAADMLARCSRCRATFSDRVCETDK